MDAHLETAQYTAPVAAPAKPSRRHRRIGLVLSVALAALVLRGLESGMIQTALATVAGHTQDDRALHIFSTDEGRAAYHEWVNEQYSKQPSGDFDDQTSTSGELVLQTKMMEVTAYCACTHCCGKNAKGITASGKPVSYNGGKFVAADINVLPFGTELRIPGYTGDTPVEVVDTGSAIIGNRLDVYFDSHDEARQWGRQWLPVKVVQTFN